MHQKKSSVGAITILALAMIWSLSSCSSNDSPSNSGGGGTTTPPPNNVEMVGIAYNPTSITISVGEKITWTNNDSVDHTVTSDDGKFTSSGNIAPGGTYEVTFNTVGTFPYHCTIHPSMTGTITVSP